ncbi:hypothetical protein V5O48_007314 [Marasmius crinis-equi]|uniref:Uncharacterized protein n=1 Tax=Marasmius crinis-equi TaxID=585013 RepID=A0ABR3FH13_9AGAR
MASLWLTRKRPSQSGSSAVENRDRSFTIMLIVSSVMFFVATLHFIIALYRLACVWIIGEHLAPPLAGLTTLNTWDNGLWVAGNWKVIVVPMILLLGEIATGYACTAMFVESDPLRGKLNPMVQFMMQTFYVLAVLGNMIPTGLMVFRLWSTHRKSSNSAITTPSILYPVLRILIESASLQLIVEVILLGLFDSGRQEQFIVLPLIVPVVGITFSLITIRIKLVASKRKEQPSYTSNDSSSWRFKSNRPQHQVRTIGSLPSSPRSPRRLSIWVDREMTSHDSEVLDISPGK